MPFILGAYDEGFMEFHVRISQHSHPRCYNEISEPGILHQTSVTINLLHPKMQLNFESAIKLWLLKIRINKRYHPAGDVSLL